MNFDLFLSPLISASINLTFRKPIDAVKDLLKSKDANNFAAKRLQHKWEPIIQGQYNFVITNFYTSLNEIILNISFDQNINKFEETITNLLAEKSKGWTTNNLDTDKLELLISDYFKELIYFYIYNHTGFSNLTSNIKLDTIINKLAFDFEILNFQKFDKILKNGFQNFPDKFLISKDLLFFTPNEDKIINKVKGILSDSNASNSALIIGSPSSGKTVLSFSIAKQLFSSGFHLFYYRVKSQSREEIVFNEMYRNDYPNYIYILDDCHQNIPFTNEVINKSDNLSNASCLFISRDLPKNLRCIEEYENEDFYQKFSNRKFSIRFFDDKQYSKKVKGIVEKYNTYYRTQNELNLKVGDINRVINNSHKNLLTLYYNLYYWRDASELSRVDKKFVLSKIAELYLASNRDLILKVACLWQYEIYYKCNSNEEEIALNNLVAKGILNYDSEINSYHFYHSDFASLLLLSYESKNDFKAFHNSLRDFTFENINSYILSFKKYPPNLEEVLHILARNHFVDLLIRLLKNEHIQDKIIAFYQNNGSIVKLLFILYILQNKKYSIVKQIVQGVSDSRWLSLLKELRLQGLSYSLMCLRETYPEKSEYLIKGLDLKYVSEKSQISNIVLISNSLIELNKISPRFKLGTKVFLNFEISFLVSKMNMARFEHIGKSLSEFRKINKRRTKELYLQLNIDRVISNSKNVNLKALGKTLNELNTLEKDLKLYNQKYPRKILYEISDNLLLDKCRNVSLEGLGRALNELKNIDLNKTRRIFLKLDILFIKNELLKVQLHQIGHTLSELRKIDIHRTFDIYSKFGIDELAYKITDQNLQIQKITYALRQLSIIDVTKEKLKNIINKVSIEYFIKKFRKVDFIRFSIALNDFKLIDPDKASLILDKISSEHILEKAKKERFDNLGSSIYKISQVNSSLSKILLHNINWNNYLRKGPTISFDKFCNSLNDLYLTDSDFTKNFTSTIDFNFILKIANKSGRNSLFQGLSKLGKIDQKIVDKIEVELNLSKTQYNPRFNSERKRVPVSPRREGR